MGCRTMRRRPTPSPLSSSPLILQQPTVQPMATDSPAPAERVLRSHGAGVLLALAAAAALFAATAVWPDTPDGLFHLHRVRALADALRSGVLLPRWLPDFAFGYGYPVFHFYAPAFYYPPALLHLLGADVLTAARLALAALFGLSGWAMLALLRRWTALPFALLGALAYLAFPYRHYDLFVRGALPEFAAFLWLPLLAHWGVAAASTDRRSAVAPAALAWAGLVLTHNLSALMAAVGAGMLAAAVGAGAAAAQRPRPWRALWRGLLLPLALALLLTAWYTLPAVLEAGWVALGATAETHGYARHFASLPTLFDWRLSYPYPSAVEPVVPLPGWTLAAALGAAALAASSWGRERRFLLGAAAGGVLLAAWLQSETSAPLWQALAPVLGKLQFPWRWQTVAALSAPVALAVAADLLWRRVGEAGRPWTAWAAAAAPAGLLLWSASAGLAPGAMRLAPGDVTAEQMWAFDAEHGQVGATWAGEFLPRWVTEQRWAIGREPSAGSPTVPEPVMLAARPAAVGHTSVTYVTAADQATRLTLPRFYFPAWRTTVDGAPVAAEPVGDLGWLGIPLPPGEHTVQVAWGATPALWAGRALALAGWLALLVLLARSRARRPAALWLVGGLALISAALLPLERMSAPPAVADGDFGPLRLEAHETQLAAGDLAVTLYWTVQEPAEPLSAFVHVAPAGGGPPVAQHDGPPGGPYLPSARWLPGLALVQQIRISLPAALPPGSYAVSAGLYRPGAPAAPLGAAALATVEVSGE